MSNARYYMNIKDKKIPVIIRSYRNTNKVRMFFRESILNISKPKYISSNKLMKIIKQSEDEIYNEYVKIHLIESNNIKHWNSGEKILYCGEEFTIEREILDEQKIKIQIENDEKIIKIFTPKDISEEEIKQNVDNGIKRIFKNKTTKLINERLPYWSEVTKINYRKVKISDTVSKFGSCKPSDKTLYFSSRLIMLPLDKVDAIIVHELCHMIHANHSKEFYDLVKKYIKNYDEIDKWLKVNSKQISI